jgi:hypothetical protein
MKGILNMSETILPSNASDEAVVTPTKENALPEALQIPTRPKPVGWRLALSLANVAVWMCTIPIFQILVPNQIAALDPVNKVTLLASISLVGGIASIIGNLLAGALSDRTTSRLGRRRPWIIVGFAARNNANGLNWITALSAANVEKLAWVRQAAGERFSELEFSTTILWPQ